MPEVRITTLLRLIVKVLGALGVFFFVQLLGSILSVPPGPSPIYSLIAFIFLAILLISSILALLS